MKLRRPSRDALAASLLALFTVAWMLQVEGNQGIGRDEGQYMRAGERYWGWFSELGTNLRQGRLRASFTPSGIDRYWGDNAPDHPVIMKTLYGLSWRLFTGREATVGQPLHPVPTDRDHGAIRLFKRPSTAFRFPAILCAGLLVALTYLFARRFVTVPAAAVAAILTIAQPHTFFHAQIACFDAPVTTMAVAVGFAYWKSLRSRRWGLLTGVIFGIALGVKHNAWLMPFFLVGHYLWMRRRDVMRLRPPRIPLCFVSMAIIGPLVFLAHWPWLWVNPVARTRAYLLRHLEHEHYNFEYLGRNWNNPPVELDRKLVRVTFPFVSTALTIPVTTLALAAAGSLVWARRRRQEVAAERDDGVILLPDPPPPADARASWLLPAADVDRAPAAFFAVQILGPMAVVALPATPIFGGVKHFMPAFPYLAMVAGVGFAWLLARLTPLVKAWRPSSSRALPVALATLCVLPAVAETQRSHPDGLSHYNLLAGGFAGGASLGMNRQFWGYSVKPLLPWMAEAAPPPTPIYWHDVLRDALNMYIRDGAAPWLGDAGGGEEGIARSSLAIIVHERHFALYEGLIWENYGTTQPAAVRTHEGVPLVTAYKRPPHPPPAAGAPPP